MLHAAELTEQRRHLRAQLNLPVRLRWLGPLGPVMEVTETLDVSRDGLLFWRTEPTPLNAKVWVTFPYHPDETDTQPETPARVARVKDTPAGGHLVAVEFETERQHPAGAVQPDQRRSKRFALALPVRVRLPGRPWPEETMTIDVSDGGVLFRTSRLYAVGDTVQIALPYGRWASRGEVTGRVIRIQAVSGVAELRVAVAFPSPALH